MLGHDNRHIEPLRRFNQMDHIGNDPLALQDRRRNLS